MTLPVPQNLEAEEHVLGAMLLSSKAIETVAEILDEDDFYRSSHAMIFTAMLALKAKGEPIDAVTVANELEPNLEAVGGSTRLAELVALTPSTSNVAHYARIVKETATLRGLVRTGQEITRLGMERPGEVTDLVSRAAQIVSDLALPSATRLRGQGLVDVLERGIPETVELVEGVVEAATVGTISALPELGKSFLAGNLLTAIAGSGRKFLGRDVLRTGPVGGFWQDDSEANELRRIQQYARQHRLADDLPIRWYLNEGLRLPQDLGALRSEIERHGFVLIVLDSLYNFLAGIDLKDEVVAGIIASLKSDVCDRTGCAVAFVDHAPWPTDSNRGQRRGYGSVFKAAAIRWGIYLDREGPKLYIEARGNNVVGFKRSPAYFDADALELRLVDVQEVDAEELDDRVRQYVMSHPGAATKHIEDGVEGGRESIRKSLGRLSEPGDTQSIATAPGRHPRGNYWYPADHAALQSPDDLLATLGETSPRLSQVHMSPESQPPRRGGDSAGDTLDAGDPEPSKRREPRLSREPVLRSRNGRAVHAVEVEPVPR